MFGTVFSQIAQSLAPFSPHRVEVVCLFKLDRVHYIKSLSLVTERGVNLELIEEDEWLPVELLVDHHPEDAHLGRAAVVQLPGPQIHHVGLSPREISESDGEGGSTCARV
jgi:hypothetical protein